jgi:hypothetical protein
MISRMPTTLQLSQAVALEAGIRARTYGKVSDLWSLLRRAPLLDGIIRTYQPLDAEGDEMPAERKHVQVRAETVLRQAAGELAALWDMTATRDWGNCTARADVTVDGQVLIAGAPVPYLLFLHKQLADLRTVVLGLPVHDPADRWVQDDSAGLWRTDPPVITNRTQKVPRNHVRAAATDRHPAQVDVYHEDRVVGHWTATKFSGAVPAARQVALLARIEALQAAVVKARQTANASIVPEVRLGDDVLGWLLAA